MIQPFKFVHLPDIIFGVGSFSKLPTKILDYGKTVILLHGKSYNNRNYAAILNKQLVANKIQCYREVVDNEPSPELVDSITNKYRSEKINVVVSIGGGSVIDAGKAVSAMIACKGFITDYLEGVGILEPTGVKLPFIAVPTTSGTGSEMTKNAVITKYGKNPFKKSLRHNNYVPDIAIVDPELTLTCPPEVTAASGLDAFSQLLESYLSTTASVMTDTLAVQGMKYLYNWLPIAFNDGNNIEARSYIAYAAMLSGITLANAGLGLVHGYAQPLGSLFPIPHGVVCGSMMAVVNEYTLNHILQNNSHTNVLRKYAHLGREIIDKNIEEDKQASLALVSALNSFAKDLKIPQITDFGVKESDIDQIVSNTGLKNHPVQLTSKDVKQIIKNCLR